MNEKMSGTKKQGASELSRVIGVPQRTISNYVLCLYLEPETQKMIEQGKIPHTYAEFVTRLYPDHPEAKAKVEQMIRENKFDTRKDLRYYVNDFIEKAKKEEGN